MVLTGSFLLAWGLTMTVIILINTFSPDNFLEVCSVSTGDWEKLCRQSTQHIRASSFFIDQDS